MKVVCAIDSMKGSLTSLQCGEAAAEGIKKVYPDADIVVRPLADGGEGTVDALVAGMNGRLEHVEVTGPHGRPVVCPYGIIEGDAKPQADDASFQAGDASDKAAGAKVLTGATAVIEMSGAAGITMVSGEEKNPMNTTTYGVGEVIRDAIQKGCRRFIVGIGGSATNDGGVGMLQALGFGFLDKDGNQVAFGAKGLKDIESIDDSGVLKELKDCEFQIACDVTNPLCGEQGCSAIFGPQKGADATMVMQMDKWLAYYASLAREKYPDTDPKFPGSGAAGGLGFAFRTFLHGKLESGISIVLRETKLADYVKDADVVITGEGRLDGQTAFGKAPVGVAELAKKFDRTVLAFAGSVTKDANACNDAGIDAFFPILRGVVTLAEAMDVENAKANMAAATEQAFRLMKACGKQ